jgi:hypothetical protein
MCSFSRRRFCGVSAAAWLQSNLPTPRRLAMRQVARALRAASQQTGIHQPSVLAPDI